MNQLQFPFFHLFLLTSEISRKHHMQSNITTECTARQCCPSYPLQCCVVISEAIYEVEVGEMSIATSNQWVTAVEDCEGKLCGRN